MPAEEADVGNIFTAVRYGHFAGVFADGDKGYNLIVGPLDIQLNLRVLVGNAEALYGSGAGVYHIALIVLLLADAFSPKLAVPVGKKAKIVAIRHHNVYIFAMLHGYVHERRARKSGVGRNAGLVADAVHKCSACKHTLYIYAENGCGKESHGTEL